MAASFFMRLFAPKKVPMRKAGPRKPDRRQLFLERLEDRTLPSLNPNLFQIDGNTVQVNPPPGDDWDTLYNHLPNSAVAFTGVIADNVPKDQIFTGGQTADVTDLNQWRWTTGTPQSKADIVNAYGAAYVDNNQLDVFVGQDRLVSNGSAALGFWFFQQNITLNANGTFNGTHTAGDVLI
jgi:hypothetical protein